jgi:uncharacterized membrane protein (UPF0127 family)
MLYAININGEEFRTAVVDTPELRYKGLSNQPKLGKRKGMLFVFEKPDFVKMEMRDMNFDLDFIFLDKSWNVLQVSSASKDEKGGIRSEVPVSMVLEVNKGTAELLNVIPGTVLRPEGDLKVHSAGVQKFKSGGKFELVGEKIYKVKESDIKAEPGKLQLLDEHGEVAANVESGARIFSRGHTKRLIELAKSKSAQELGEFVVAVLDIQDKQKQDYVSND